IPARHELGLGTRPDYLGGRDGAATMRMIDIIARKRDGGALSRAEIEHFISRYAAGDVPDYQASALTMAIFLRGMTSEELADLVRAMIDSGERYELDELGRLPVDKHSTGGVGDKVSLVLAPLVAAAGVPVPMVAGRGLGHTGGTLDKLEAIPGFCVRQSGESFRRQLGAIGVAIIGQTDSLVPADKKLYALRDVTATVESIPLIAASIMSKKIAAGARGLVMDVKTGNGAFMADEERARELARTLVGIGRAAEMTVVAYLTDMSQPLGRAIGNANEVIEAIETLKGRGPADLWRVTETLGAEMLLLGGAADSAEAALECVRWTLDSGAALERFRALVEAQGGDPRIVDDYSLLQCSEQTVEVCSPEGGWLAGLDTREIGAAACVLGAGREQLTDAIDPGVGITMLKKLGGQVAAGEALFRVAWREQTRRDACLARLREAFTIGQEPLAPPELIKARISC
ncbi:thymidine phosphorylase, partial [Candidatus Sumerlaeota bacterium]